MPIKNYRTTVKSIKTVGEIQEILAAAGARSVSVEYFDKEPDAVKFSLDVYRNNLAFRLPSNPHGVLETLKRDGAPKSFCNLEHSRHVSWRIIKDWLHSQISIIDAGQAQVAEVFFPYLLDADGETLYRKFEFQQLQLNGE